MTLQWSLANRRGILFDASVSNWQAGHVNDLLEIDSGSVLAASATGGVWQLLSEFGVPLSMDWDSPDTYCLARGPHGSVHIYAGGVTPTGNGALHQTDVTSALPLLAPWRLIPLTAEVGLIRRIVIDEQLFKIVLATDKGLWFASIPPAGSDALSFRLAAGTQPAVGFRDVALAANHTIVAATTGADGGMSGNLGFFVGSWVGDELTMLRATMRPDIPTSRLAFTTLAVAPSNPNIVYAACTNNDDHPGGSGTFSAFLRSENGGVTWAPRNAFLAGTTSIIADHSQMGYSGALAVSPWDADTVVLGYTRGPYVSRDGGGTFSLAAMQHDDKHTYRFSGTLRDRLYEASDGGIAYTEDFGATSHSDYNRYLANLQFYGPSGAREAWGRASTSSLSGGSVTGGGLQDNNDVYSVIWPGGSATPWYPLLADLFTDGQAVFFPATGGAIYTFGDTRTAAWRGPLLHADPTPIHVRRGKPGVTHAGDTIGGLMATVTNPEWRSAPPRNAPGQPGQLMIAVLAAAHKVDQQHWEQKDLYGLFANDDGSDKHWDYLGTLPLEAGQIVSALASLTGRSILVGIRGGGEIWLVNPADVSRAARSNRFTHATGSNVVVAAIVIESENPDITAFAAYSDFGSGSGFVFRTTAHRIWSPCPTPFGSPLYALATGGVGDGRLLFAATDDKVFVSEDHGDSWRDESSGLPQRPHCSDLAFANQPDGTALLYLATYGWSMWVTPVRPCTVNIRQTTSREPCSAFFGNQEFVAGEYATLRADVSCFEGGSPTYAWFAFDPADIESQFEGGIPINRADERDCGLTVPTDTTRITVTLTVRFPSGYTREVTLVFRVLSEDEANSRLLTCQLHHVRERINRIPPIIILNRPGPDPGPAAIARDVRQLGSDLIRLAEQLEQGWKEADSGPSLGPG